MTQRAIQQIFAQVQALKKELEQNPGVSRPKADKLTLELVVTDSELLKVVSKLFNDGHHARAVEEAFKYLNNLVKRKTGESRDGAKLMKEVFSPVNPKLKLNSLVTRSEEDEQLGYMEIMAGVMTGIRNPRAHEHDWEDSESHALQLLSWANHLVEKVKNAKSP